MEVKIPEKTRDIFSVFFYAVKNEIFLTSFLYLIILLGINFIFLFLGHLGASAGLLGVIYFLCFIVDFYLLLILGYIISLKVSSFIQHKNFITLREIFLSISANINALLLFPLFLILVLLCAIILIAFISLLLNIPLIGSFIYSALFFVKFLIALLVIMIFLIMGYVFNFLPTLVSETNETSLFQISKYFTKVIYLFWPKITFLNIAAVLINGILSFILSLFSLFAVVICFISTGIFTKYEFVYLMKALPSGITDFLYFFSFLIPSFRFFGEAFTVPDYYKVSAVILFVSFFLIFVFLATFSIVYQLVSNYFIYHIIQRDVENVT